MAKEKTVMDNKHDIFDRYKSSTSIDQTYNAIAAIGRLRDDCYRYFRKGSKPFRKWHTECNDLFNLLNKVPVLVRMEKRTPLRSWKISSMNLSTWRGAFANCLTINPCPKQTGKAL